MSINERGEFIRDGGALSEHKKFEIKEQQHPDLLDFDNGESKAHLNLFDLRNNLNGSISPEGLVVVENKLREFQRKVVEEKAKGIHLGSSQIEYGISGEIAAMSPQELGLETEKEVKLLSAVILSLAKK